MSISFWWLEIVIWYKKILCFCWVLIDIYRSYPSHVCKASTDLENRTNREKLEKLKYFENRSGRSLKLSRSRIVIILWWWVFFLVIILSSLFYDHIFCTWSVPILASLFSNYYCRYQGKILNGCFKKQFKETNGKKNI